MVNVARGRRTAARWWSVVAAGCLGLGAVAAAPAGAADGGDSRAGTAPAATAGVRAEPVEAGVPYYLVATRFDRGLTFRRESGGDAVRFTDRAGQYGKAVVFEKRSDAPYGEGYVIKMQRPGGATAFCHQYGRVLLMEEQACRNFPWTPEPQGDSLLFRTRWDGDRLYLAAAASVDKDGALYTKGRYGGQNDRQFVEFKAARAR
ncbi:hypothetical protein ACSNOK_06660 [Streptomyces sp. URMC 126]|uniref:hypothetical protein n=1 Tax=Streptomyces sp. URMC 126 TaxID=3423401 RepID=UPI003F194DDB